MEIFSQLLGIKGFHVRHVDMSDTELHLYLECEFGTGVCSRCGQTSQQVRQTYHRVLRDLPLSGKACYLHVGKRYFDCLRCRETFAEPLDFADPKRDDTTRYEESLFHQVRQTTVWYVALQEGLTDQVVTGKVDSEVIAEFCQRLEPQAWTPPTPVQRELRDLTRHQDALKSHHWSRDAEVASSGIWGAETPHPI